MHHLILPGFIVLFGFVLFLLIRNDTDENKKLTKKGYTKLFIGMGLLVVMIIAFVMIIESVTL